MRHTVLSAVFAFVACGCASWSASSDAAVPCELGETCHIQGWLTVESLWQASLDLPQSCHALALPEAFYAEYKHLDGKWITVSGKAFSQPPHEPGTFSYGYVVEGMRVNVNLCGSAMVVREIRAGDKVLWP